MMKSNNLSSPSSTEPPRPKRGRRPKAKGMPNRPLSAYNLFFKEERKNILKDIEDGTARDDYLANAKATQKPGSGNMGPAKFQAIARTIASRWKTLGDEDRKVFEALAVKEMEAYKVKKEEYHRKLVREVGAVASAEVDSLNESRSTQGSESKNDSSLKAVTRRDPLLGATVPAAPFSMNLAHGTKAPTSSLSPQDLDSLLLIQQRGLVSSSTLPGLSHFTGLPRGMSSIAPEPHLSALWPEGQSGSSSSLRMALQIEELRRREQTILLAERLHQRRQMLREHRLLQAHLALQQQQPML